MKKYNSLLIIILLTIVSLTIVLISTGNNNLFGSTTDWLSQHIAFPDYFRKLFYDTGNIIPNFAPHLGAGQNIFNFAYYGLLSPYVLLSYLFPFISMSSYLIIINIVVVIISGYLFYRWLVNNHYSNQTVLTTTILFLLANSLLFHTHRHFMFINYMPFLILGLMGVDLFFSQQKRWLCALSIFLMIMTSYYFSVSGILVVAIYWLYKYIKINNDFIFGDFIRSGLQFVIPIIVGILMAGVLLMPIIMVISQGRGTSAIDYTFSELIMPRFNIDAILYDHYGIGLTSFGILALVLGLFSKVRANKFLSIMIIVVTSIPIFIYLLNGGLYLRDKVLIPFLPLMGLIIVGLLDGIINMQIKLNNLLINGFIISLFIYICGLQQLFFYIELGIILLLIYFYYTKHWWLPLNFGLIIIAIVVNIPINLSENYVGRNYYEKYFGSDVNNLISSVTTEDKSFYRFNNLLDSTYYSANKIYNANYYQTSLYSSTFNQEYYDFFVNDMSNAFRYRNEFVLAQTNNIIYQTLMGVKYILTDNIAPIGYQFIKSKEELSIYKNENVFPLGYATDAVISVDDYQKIKYPFNTEVFINNIVVNNESKDNLNSHIEKIKLLSDYVVPPGITISREQEQIKIDSDNDNILKMNLDNNLKNQILFIDFDVKFAPNCGTGDIRITINDITNTLTCKQWLYFNDNYHFSYVLSSSELINHLDVTFSKGHFVIDTIEFHTLDYQYVENSITKMDPLIVDMKKTQGDRIVGAIDVSKDGYFATTIPYDEGFEILVNGEPTEYEKVNTAFVGFPISQGNYEIEITYQAPGVETGKLLSIIGIFYFFVLAIIDNSKKTI